MDASYDRFIVRAATIDELLSDDFEALPGQKADADLAARRLAAWCRACASGDWSLFSRRLAKDGWTIDQVITKLATVRRKASAPLPAWAQDAIWIDATLQGSAKAVGPIGTLDCGEPCAFEHLFTSVVDQAELRLWSDIGACDSLTDSARACLRRSLLRDLCTFSAPALYERFDQARKAAGAPPDPSTVPQNATRRYNQFVTEMKGGGFRRLFEDKPVMLRLIASITRQWLDTSRELIMRLDGDLAAIRQMLRRSKDSRVTKIETGISDPHNGGHSVKIISFTDGSRVLYKPKDLQLDIAWYDLIRRLNQVAPIELKAVHAIARNGYGWTEFVS